MKMKNALSSTFFIYIVKILTVNSQEKSTTGPGISSCFYYANSDMVCDMPLVEIKDLPERCTSFVVTELVVSRDFQVFTPYYDNYDFSFLKTVGTSGKNVYITYKHSLLQNFIDILNEDETIAMNEINNLIAVKNGMPGVTGLLILDFEEVSKELGGLTEKVAKYLDLVTKKAQLEVGLLFGRNIVDYCDDATFSWLNFTILNNIVTFYVVSLCDLSEKCTSDLRNTGVAPMGGEGKYTLEKVACSVQKANIPKEKLYFMFSVCPNEFIVKEPLCDATYHKICVDPSFTVNYCADTQETLYAKGKWANSNGKGFVGRYVDFDDSRKTCNCGLFPAFHAILAGMTGSSVPPVCPLFDRKP